MPADTTQMTPQEIADLNAFNAANMAKPEFQALQQTLNDPAAFAASLAASKAAEDAAIAQGFQTSKSIGTFANSPGIIPGAPAAPPGAASLTGPVPGSAPPSALAQFAQKVPGGNTTIFVVAALAIGGAFYMWHKQKQQAARDW